MEAPDYAPHPTERHWKTGEPLMVRLINDATRTPLDDFDELHDLAGVAKNLEHQIDAMEDGEIDAYHPKSADGPAVFIDDVIYRRLQLTRELLSLHAFSITRWPEGTSGAPIRRIIELAD